jgi:hypothetical protein
MGAGAGAAAGWEGAATVAVDCEGGEAWPLVWGASPLTSAIMKGEAAPAEQSSVRS